MKLLVSIEISINRALFDFYFQDTREKNEAFGSSLLLANSPMSPKVVNGSFAAIIDADEFLAKAYAGIRIAVSFFTRIINMGNHVRQVVSCFFLLIISVFFNDAESRFSSYEAQSTWDSHVGSSVFSRFTDGSCNSRH